MPELVSNKSLVVRQRSLWRAPATFPAAGPQTWASMSALVWTSRESKPLARQKAHYQIDAQNQRHQDERGRPSLRVPLVVRRNCIVVYLHRQGSDWFVEISREETAAKGGEQQRSGFARDARDRQHGARRDSRRCCRNYHAHRDSPLRRAQRQRAFAQTVRPQR